VEIIRVSGLEGFHTYRLEDNSCAIAGCLLMESCLIHTSIKCIERLNDIPLGCREQNLLIAESVYTNNKYAHRLNRMFREQSILMDLQERLIERE